MSLESLHFACPNAYVPEVFDELFEALDEHYDLHAFNNQSHNPSSEASELQNWEQLSDDLVHQLRQVQTSNWVGMGHSLGAALSVIAATKHPELFSSLVLVEPAILPQYIYKITDPIPFWLRKIAFPPARVSKSRTHLWESREDAYNHFRPKHIFKGLSDNTLWQYMEHGLIPATEGGFTLRISREWETQIYITIYNIWPLLQALKIPVKIIRGTNSNVIPDRLWFNLRKKFPHFDYSEVAGGSHLLPLERPLEVVKLIRD